MDSERWKKVKNILEEAMEFSPAQRSAYLEKVCGADNDLRREVESLLDFSDAPADLLENPAFDAVFNEKENPAVGSRVDKYRINGTLGAGGMGAVYLAERADGQFNQKVALKLIKRGMDSDAVTRRFINERQILASLEHPNIARLIDGGTTHDGLPFFVMEYVEGVTITDYARVENLDLEARLNLFRRICAAVSFAHSNLIVHRDLKPSNILVANDGAPKLLDFGIAKILKAENGNETATQNFVFTPEYASPEQVRGEKLTTATDVYSLGVILYELLTGNRPYKTGGANISDIIKSVCETEPPRPSSVVSIAASAAQPVTRENNQRETAADQPILKSAVSNPKSLRGDLDNIILKALRKEPARRYSSVEQFSEDVRRHLAGLPVTASADTWTYRASKFVQRNRLAAAAAGLILVSLLGGIAATSYQANMARQEKARAEQSFNDVRQLANSFLFEFHDEISTLSGATPARELVVKRALEYLNKLTATGDPNDAGLQRELATAYERVGKIQGNSYYSNLGDTAGAMESYRRSLEIRQKLNRADPNNREIQDELAAGYEGVGDMFYGDNDLPNALQHYERALAIRQPLVEAVPNNTKFARALSELHARTGDVKGMEGYANLGDTLGAVEQYERAVAVSEKLVAAAPDDDDSQSVLALRRQSLTMLQSTVGKSAQALETGRKVAATFETLIARDPENAALKRNLMLALTILRYPLLDEGLTTEAEQNARRIISQMEKAVAEDPKNANARRSLSVSYNSLGRVLKDAGNPQEAIKNHELARKIIETLAADTPSGEFKTDVTLTRGFLAEAQLAAGDYATALANFRSCAADYEAKLGDEANVRTKDDLAAVYTGIGNTLAATKDFRGADEFFKRAVPLAEEAANKSPHNVRIQNRLAKIYYDSGKNLRSFAATAKDENARRQSCAHLQKSFNVWDALQRKQILSKSNANRPNEVAGELSGCGTI